MSLSRREQLAYALPAFGLAVVGIPVYVYMPKFYTDVVGLDVAWVGVWLLAVRLFDAATDPWIGRLSDRIETRFGRRRPWIALGAFPLAASLVALLAPPAGAGAPWFAVSIFAVFLWWTVVSVPYESLGPEIARGYHERTRTLGLRDGLLIAGTLVAAASPWLAGLGLDTVEGSSRERQVFQRVALVYAPLLVALCWVCVAGVREVPRAARAGGGPLELRTMLRNRPFVVLLVSYAVSSLGSNLPATLLPFYAEYVLGVDGVEAFLLLYFAVGVLCLPGWIRLARHTGKKTAWLLAMAVNSGAFIGVYTLGPGQVGAYATLVALSGVGFGATLALPSAMQADVVDYDEWLVGARREGQYLGIWAVARKLAAALGVGVGLWLLGRSGYTPGVEQSPAVVERLKLLYALVPCLCNAAAFAVALRYPLDQTRLEAVQREIDARREGGVRGAR